MRSHTVAGSAGWQHGRRLRLAGGALFLLVAASLAAVPSVLAATLYVDPAAASAAPGSGCGAAAAYTQICAAPGPGAGTPCAVGSALADANPGDTIEVCAATYPENVEISTSNVTLRGAKAGVPAGPDAAPAGRGIGESIIVGQTTSAVHLSVGGITGSVIDGFTIQSGNFPAIHDNPNTASGSHVWANNILEGSASCGPGLINLTRIDGTQILNNNLRGCQWGISVQPGNPADAPSLIEGNYIVDNSSSAGAVIMSANNAPGHVIRGNLIEGTGAGMILGCADLEIADNTIQNRGTAIFLHTNATGATITGNDLLNNSNGVRQSVVFGPYTLGPLNEVHYNNIVGSTLFGARNEVTPGDQDIQATCNWWGSADGPFPTGSGDEVTAGVEYVPWLVAPAPGGACTGGLVTTTTTVPTTTTTTTSTTTTTMPPVGICPLAPTGPCRAAAAGRSIISIKAGSKLDWRWKNGAPTDLADFADPIAGTATYNLCVYDGSSTAIMDMEIPTGSGWHLKQRSVPHYRFKNKAATPDGIRKATLKPSTAHIAPRVYVSGKGPNLPSLTIPAAFPLTVQLIVNDGATVACWGTEYTTARRNENGKINAKGP